MRRRGAAGRIGTRSGAAPPRPAAPQPPLGALAHRRVAPPGAVGGKARAGVCCRCTGTDGRWRGPPPPVCVWGGRTRRRRAIATCGPGAPPAGPRQVQTGLPTPFPAAGGGLRVAPQNTHRHGQTETPPLPPHLKARGS